MTRAEQRVFDVLENGENVTRVEVYKEFWGFGAYDFNFVINNSSITALTVWLVVGIPVICG